MKIGVSQTKDVVIAVAKLGSAGAKALADGKIGIGDVIYLYEPLTALQTAAEGAGGVPSELADLDADELKDLAATFIKEFDLPQDDVEEVVERAVSLASQLAAFFLSFRKTAA